LEEGIHFAEFLNNFQMAVFGLKLGDMNCY